MKYLINLLILLTFISTAQAFELKVGDILLIELRCYSCPLIADETGSRFSHSGVVVAVNRDQVLVAQALGPLHALPLSKFVSQRTKGTTILVRRAFKDISRESLFLDFKQHWQGLPFDSAYVWDDEKLYCSEFVAKFLNPYLDYPFKAKPLDFSRNWDFWSRVMPHVPQGELGNSPADFEFHEALFTVGEID